jgi:hypothetical protein
MTGSFLPEFRTPLPKRRFAFSLVPCIERLAAGSVAGPVAKLSRNSRSFPAVLTASEQHGMQAWR